MRSIRTGPPRSHPVAPKRSRAARAGHGHQGLGNPAAGAGHAAPTPPPARRCGAAGRGRPLAPGPTRCPGSESPPGSSARSCPARLSFVARCSPRTVGGSAKRLGRPAARDPARPGRRAGAGSRARKLFQTGRWALCRGEIRNFVHGARTEN